MALSKAEISQVLTAARALQLDTPEDSTENFISTVLGLNAAQRVTYFPSPDPGGLLAIAVAHLTGERERLLRDECIIPSFAIYQDANGSFRIAGLDTYLASKNVTPSLRERLKQHSAIR